MTIKAGLETGVKNSSNYGGKDRASQLLKLKEHISMRRVRFKKITGGNIEGRPA